MQLNSKVLILIAMLILCFVLARVDILMAEPLDEDNATSENSIINLLIQKGIFSQKDVKELKEKKHEKENDLRVIIELLKQKGIIDENEARSLIENSITVQNQTNEKETRSQLHQEQNDDKDFVEREELQEIEKKLEKQIEDAQTRSRLNERDAMQLEKQRIDPLADDMRKAGWAKRISLGGDLRLRYQKDIFYSDNDLLLKPDEPSETMNTREDRVRWRARARLNLKANLIDPRDINVGKVIAGLRLSTGNEDDPVSTNETLGDYNNKDTVVFDRYFLQWIFRPLLPLWGRIPEISLTGGRMPNPWFSSDLVWDNDLNFEGVALTLKTDTLQENGWFIFITAGAFPLQELEISSDDKWLYGGQIGFQVEPIYGLSVTMAGAYYQFENITGEVNDPLEPGLTDYTAPIYQQKGNTLIDIDPGSDIKTALAAEFTIVDVDALVDFTYFFPVHVMLEGTYVRNVGFDKKKVAEKTGIPDIEEATEAYRFGMKVGYPIITQFAEWNFFYCYKYLESDSVLDAFTDSDFHLGGTNAKGWIAGLEFGLYENVWLTARWLTADEIEGPALAIDVLQIDINARF